LWDGILVWLNKLNLIHPFEIQQGQRQAPDASTLQKLQEKLKANLKLSINATALSPTVYKVFAEKDTNIKTQVTVKELPPNNEARYLIRAMEVQIKSRTEPLIGISNEAQLQELKDSDIHAIGFVSIKETRSVNSLDLFFIRLIIGDTYIFHVKISVERGTGSGLFGLDGKEADLVNKTRFTLMRVLGPKKEEDSVDFDEHN